MQIYADITGRKIKVLKSDQVCAVGSAILAACNNKEGYLNLKTTQNKMSIMPEGQEPPCLPLVHNLHDVVLYAVCDYSMFIFSKLS